MPRGPPDRGTREIEPGRVGNPSPLAWGPRMCIKWVVRRKSQYTTLKWNFLHRGDYPAGRFWTCSAKVPFRGNGPDSYSNLVSCWVGNVPMTYYNLNKENSHGMTTPEENRS